MLVKAAASLEAVQLWFLRSLSPLREDRPYDLEVLHETNGYLKDIVAQEEIGEVIPHGFDALFGVQKRLTIITQSRHVLPVH